MSGPLGGIFLTRTVGIRRSRGHWRVED